MRLACEAGLHLLFHNNQRASPYVVADSVGEQQKAPLAVLGGGEGKLREVITKESSPRHTSLESPAGLLVLVFSAHLTCPLLFASSVSSLCSFSFDFLFQANLVLSSPVTKEEHCALYS